MSPSVKAIDGQSIYIYRSLKITIKITDHNGKMTQQWDKFMVTNFQGYDFILDELWLQTQNPNIDQIEKIWVYMEWSESFQPLIVYIFLAEASKVKYIFTI